MVVIDVIKLLGSGDLFSVIVTRNDLQWIVSRSSLATSLDTAKQDVEDKKRFFHKVGRPVQIRWKGVQNAGV